MYENEALRSPGDGKRKAAIADLVNFMHVAESSYVINYM